MSEKEINFDNLMQKLFSIKEYPSGRKDYLPIYSDKEEDKIKTIFKEGLDFNDFIDPLKDSDLHQYFDSKIRFYASFYDIYSKPYYNFYVCIYFTIKKEFENYHLISGFKEILPNEIQKNFFGRFLQRFEVTLENKPILQINEPELDSFIKNGLAFVGAKNTELGIIEDYQDKIFEILKNKKIIR